MKLLVFLLFYETQTYKDGLFFPVFLYGKHLKQLTYYSFRGSYDLVLLVENNIFPIKIVNKGFNL